MRSRCHASCSPRADPVPANSIAMLSPDSSARVRSVDICICVANKQAIDHEACELSPGASTVRSLSG